MVVMVVLFVSHLALVCDLRSEAEDAFSPDASYRVLSRKSEGGAQADSGL
jgi:hypothetical protein